MNLKLLMRVLGLQIYAFQFAKQQNVLHVGLDLFMDLVIRSGRVFDWGLR